MGQKHADDQGRDEHDDDDNDDDDDDDNDDKGMVTMMAMIKDHQRWRYITVTLGI